jgi:hypothetical protein
LAKINRSTEKYHSLLKRALTIIIGLLYLQLTDHANVPRAVDIFFLCRGSLRPENYFKGSSRVNRLRKAELEGYTGVMGFKNGLQALISQSSARNAPIYAGTPYRNFFLFLNFIPALINIYYTRLYFPFF